MNRTLASLDVDVLLKRIDALERLVKQQNRRIP